MMRLECPKGHYTRAEWGRPRAPACPTCDAALRPRTTLELDGAPPGMRLSELGVAPREILAVQSEGAMTLVELQSIVDQLGGIRATSRALVCSPNSVSKYYAGKMSVSPAVATALRSFLPASV